MLIDKRFPDRIAMGASGGPTYITSIIQTASRREYRNQVATLGLGSWIVSQNAKLRDDYQELLTFFRVARGRQNVFPFKDWNDYVVTAAQGILTANGVTNQYQMYKRYLVTGTQSGSPTDIYYEDRMIQLPVYTTIIVHGGTGVSVNYFNGVVTSTSQPTSWEGQFDCACRFDTDQMVAQIPDKRGDGQFITSWESIPIVEVIL